MTKSRFVKSLSVIDLADAIWGFFDKKLCCCSDPFLTGWVGLKKKQPIAVSLSWQQHDYESFVFS